MCFLIRNLGTEQSINHPREHDDTRCARDENRDYTRGYTKITLPDRPVRYIEQRTLPVRYLEPTPRRVISIRRKTVSRAPPDQVSNTSSSGPATASRTRSASPASRQASAPPVPVPPSANPPSSKAPASHHGPQHHSNHGAGTERPGRQSSAQCQASHHTARPASSASQGRSEISHHSRQGSVRPRDSVSQASERMHRSRSNRSRHSLSNEQPSTSRRSASIRKVFEDPAERLSRRVSTAGYPSVTSDNLVRPSREHNGVKSHSSLVSRHSHKGHASRPKSYHSNLSTSRIATNVLSEHLEGLLESIGSRRSQGYGAIRHAPSVGLSHQSIRDPSHADNHFFQPHATVEDAPQSSAGSRTGSGFKSAQQSVRQSLHTDHQQSYHASHVPSHAQSRRSTIHRQPSHHSDHEPSRHSSHKLDPQPDYHEQPSHAASYTSRQPSRASLSHHDEESLHHAPSHHSHRSLPSHRSAHSEHSHHTPIASVHEAQSHHSSHNRPYITRPHREPNGLFYSHGRLRDVDVPGPAFRYVTGMKAC